MGTRGKLAPRARVAPLPVWSLLEQFPVSDTEHGHILWVLPITSAELEFKKKHGLEALERRFEESDLRYWDTARASVV